jgi:predicted transcriptional regulator
LGKADTYLYQFILKGAFELATTQLLIRLPDALVRRFKRNVSVRQRSMFIQRLLEDALPPEDGSDDDPLYQAALAVEQERALAAEMAEWEVATIDDGLDDPPKKRR